LERDKLNEEEFKKWKRAIIGAENDISALQKKVKNIEDWIEGFEKGLSERLAELGLPPIPFPDA